MTCSWRRKLRSESRERATSPPLPASRAARPAGRRRYELVKEKCAGDEVQLKQALMKRCVADVPMLQFMQGEERKVQRMYSSSMIGAASYQSFQDAMAIASEELEAVKAEVRRQAPSRGLGMTASLTTPPPVCSLFLPRRPKTSSLAGVNRSGSKACTCIITSSRWRSTRRR